MPEEKSKQEEPQIQEVEITMSYLNNKLNILAGMIVNVQEQIEKLIKKL